MEMGFEVSFLHLLHRLRTIAGVHFMAFLQHIIVYTILSTLAQPLAAQNVAINQSPNFQVLPLCAGLCLQDPGTYVDVRSGIGCPADPLGHNECYCREDLKSSASSYISSCVFASCGPNTTNVVNAISVSNAYCLTAPGLNGSDSSTTMSSGGGQTATSTAGAGQSISTTNAPLTGANNVPSLVLEPISYGPPTTMPTHSPIPTYSGSGSLLQGYCNTPHYVLLDGPTAYWAPMVGCNNDKTDCCPYTVAQQNNPALATGVTVTVVSTITVNVGSGQTQVAYTGLNAYPVPVSTDVASLQRCPDDYQTVSGGCCPSGYQLWNAVLGGQVPCYSSLSDTLSAPAVPIVNYQTPIPPLSNLTTGMSTTSSTPSGSPTFAVVNVIYAAPFPLAPVQGLSTAAKAGIGTVSSVAGIAIIALVLLLILRAKKRNNDKKTYAPSQAVGLGSTVGQSQNVTSSGLPYQSEQQPTSFLPQETHVPPQQMPQMQQCFPPQNFHSQQPVQQMQQGQIQPHIQYPSTPPSTVSPPLPPSSDAGYSNQSGYPPPGPVSAYASSSTGSQGPSPQGHGYQTNVPAQLARRPVATSPTSSSPPLSQGYGYGYGAAPGQ